MPSFYVVSMALHKSITSMNAGLAPGVSQGKSYLAKKLIKRASEILQHQLNHKEQKFELKIDLFVWRQKHT